MLPAVEITSFGYLHGPAPEADLTFDLRRHFRDPHVSPELRHMTAADDLVWQTVRDTPGITDLVRAAAEAVMAYASGPSGGGKVVVASGCAGGRHRAPVFAGLLSAYLLHVHRLDSVSIFNRDMDRPVVQR